MWKNLLNKQNLFFLWVGKFFPKIIEDPKKLRVRTLKKFVQLTGNNNTNNILIFKIFNFLLFPAFHSGLCRRERFTQFDEFFFLWNFDQKFSLRCAFSTYVYISSRNWFSLKNNGKNEQLLLKTFFSKFIFRDFLLVKMKNFGQKKTRQIVWTFL